MDLIEFNNSIVSNNGKAYMVGGAVRDSLMGTMPKDRDYCVTGLTQETFESLFPSAELQGKDFPVYRLEINGEICEVALARKERKKTRGHRGFEVIFTPDVTIEQDLFRRDFRINAMAFDLSTNEIIDPYNGQKDIEDRILRATSPAFREDPLRVYRAARLAAQLDFRIDLFTLTLMDELKDELTSLSIERVYGEMIKALMSNKPSRFFYELEHSGVLDVHFPEISTLMNFRQNPKYHPEGNVFVHTMQVLDSARYFCNTLPVKNELAVMMSALLHDVGKAVTFGTHPIKGTPTYHEHEHRGVPIAEDFLSRFNLKSIKAAVLFNVKNHMIMHDAFTTMKPIKAVNFMDGKFEPTDKDTYIRNTGLLQVMDIHDYMAVCLSDTAGRVSAPSSLPDILKVTRLVLSLLSYENNFTFESISLLVSDIIEDSEQASRITNDIIRVSKHAKIMETYAQYSKTVTYSKDIAEALNKYEGEKLGYIIHKDKQQQRVSHMKTVRGFYLNKMKEAEL
ncbi:HD domain-containing protein [Cytobacillus horneckiae]|uniref:HD domain-containing protein n=1 Tax=Cytobacillus horneckiae TaxID=549687 RepID=UPI0034CF2687